MGFVGVLQYVLVRVEAGLGVDGQRRPVLAVGLRRRPARARLHSHDVRRLRHPAHRALHLHVCHFGSRAQGSSIQSGLDADVRPLDAGASVLVLCVRVTDLARRRVSGRRRLLAHHTYRRSSLRAHVRRHHSSLMGRPRTRHRAIRAGQVLHLACGPAPRAAVARDRAIWLRPRRRRHRHRLQPLALLLVVPRPQRHRLLLGLPALQLPVAGAWR